LNAGINFTIKTQCRFFSSFQVISFGCLNQAFAIWQC
jgi:hypothetical protein